MPPDPLRSHFCLLRHPRGNHSAFIRFNTPGLPAGLHELHLLRLGGEFQLRGLHPGAGVAARVSLTRPPRRRVQRRAYAGEPRAKAVVPPAEGVT